MAQKVVCLCLDLKDIAHTVTHAGEMAEARPLRGRDETQNASFQGEAANRSSVKKVERRLARLTAVEQIDRRAKMRHGTRETG